MTWTEICSIDQLIPGRGRAALVDGQQVAVYRFPGTDEVFALSNLDPFSNAYVMARGIVGTRGDTPKVAGPIFKQNFSLRTGKCLDDEMVSIPTFPVRVVEGRIEIGVT